MFFRIIQYVGIAVIVIFCAFSIILSTSERDLNTYGSTSFIYTYASFFEDRFFDLRMKLTVDRNKKDTRLILAAIDDHSLNKIGRWPWSRVKQAQIIDKLGTFGAKIIAFDVFYSEPEIACNAENPDKVFLESIKKFQSNPGKKVILPFSVDRIDPKEINEELQFKETPEQLLNFMLGGQQSAALQTTLVGKKVYPIPLLANSEAGISHIEAEADSDGVFRHYSLVANIDSFYYPSFALQAYQFYTGDQPKVDIPNIDNAKVSIKPGTTYLNFNGETKVRWLGGLDHFPVVSIYDIINANDGDLEMKNIFNNKIVFVASTAFGAHDFRNTPVDSTLPGVVFHMNMVNMLLDGRFFVSENDSAKVSWIILAVGTTCIVGVMFFGNAILDFVVVNFLLISFFLLDTYYFIPRGYNNRLFFCLSSVVLCYSWSTFLHFYQSNKEKKKIKGTFSRYLAPSIVNDLLKNPDKVKLGGEKKNITVFFSDVRDFTSISEKLTPEQLSHCLNLYMTMMTDTLFEHKGTLDKYIGDAMVAYWGAPVELEHHSYWAIKGAIQMIERLPLINEEFKLNGFPTFKHGIGLNTGDCSVGNMGSNQIFSYTALGDNMNLGARLESLCKYYGVQLNISEYTKNAIPADLAQEFTFRTLDKVRVKGKENALTIYEVLHPSHMLYKDHETLKRHEEAFELYLNQKFNEAENIFHQLHEKYPDDKSFKRMYQICKDFKEVPPPPGWDGTYTHKEK